jgi:hypothetical protein
MNFAIEKIEMPILDVCSIIAGDSFALLFCESSRSLIHATLTFVDQLDDLSDFNNLNKTTAIYHYSIPTVKLAYPEPFIASASFMHSDL